MATNVNLGCLIDVSWELRPEPGLCVTFTGDLHGVAKFFWGRCANFRAESRRQRINSMALSIS